GETLSVTAYLTSAPAGNTALPVFAVSDTSSALVDDAAVADTALVAGAEITGQVAYIAPTANTKAVSAKLIVYMNAPTKTGTYVISLVPAVAGGGVNGPDDVKMAKKARKKYKTQNKIDAANYHGGLQHYVNMRFNGIK
ncbi:MAG: hypothetical protein EBW42_09325, partial [Rhodobacterales bacterium]|nr:hypothetical protein [Rhodobacterales bacterium]